MQINLHGSLCITAVFLYCYGQRKKTKFSTESTKICHFDLKVQKIFLRRGHCPFLRLLHHIPLGTFGTRPCPPPTSTPGSAYTDHLFGKTGNVREFYRC